MKEEIEIKETEIKKLNKYAIIYGIFLIASVVLAIPLSAWLGFYAVIPWGIIFGIGIFFAFKIEKIKKANDIYTWKEIVAFDEGRLLDETSKIEEKAKRPYQAFLLFLGSGLIGFIICILMAWILSFFS